MARSISTIALYVAFLAIPLGYLYNSYIPAVQRLLTVFGVYRQPAAIRVTNAEDLVLVEGTTHCEDIHYYAPSHELYTACEDSQVRFSWFPPLAEFNASVLDQAQASVFVINPDVSS